MISIQCWLDMIDQSIAVWIQKNRARPEAMQDSICACAPRMTPACFQFQTGDIQHVRIESWQAIIRGAAGGTVEMWSVRLSLLVAS